MTPSVLIYILRDPESARPRYVGRTVRVHLDPMRDLRRRLDNHSSKIGAMRAKSNWLAGIQSQGLRATIHLVEEVTMEQAARTEARWIQYLRNRGEDLVNLQTPRPLVRQDRPQRSKGRPRASLAERPKKSPKVQLVELRNGGTPLEKLLARDFADGLSPRMLEEKYDMHFTSIYDFAREYGIKPPGRGKRSLETTTVS